MEQQQYSGRITGLAFHQLSEFGTRLSFEITVPGRYSIPCVASGALARSLATEITEGDWVLVGGIAEERPMSASPATPWRGRLRVRTLDMIAGGRAAA
jgi:hypothetical protein